MSLLDIVCNLLLPQPNEVLENPNITWAMDNRCYGEFCTPSKARAIGHNVKQFSKREVEAIQANTIRPHKQTFFGRAKENRGRQKAIGMNQNQPRQLSSGQEEIIVDGEIIREWVRR